MSEMDPKLLSRFETWLRKHSYSERTIAKYRRDLASCVKYDGTPPKSKQRRKRIIDYKLAYEVFVSADLGELPVECPVVPPVPRFGGKRSRDPKRVLPAVSYPKEDYLAILAAAQKRGDPQSLVLLVVARNGVRISDVLRAPLGELRNGMKRSDGVVTLYFKGQDEPITYCLKNGGSAEQAWRDLIEHPDCKKRPGTWHIAAAMMGDPAARAEAQYGAYERVRVALERAAADADVGGRVHLHRFRRSVGVYLAVAGATADQIQKAFGQRSPDATRRYIDEARAMQSAKLLRGIE